MTIEVHIDAYGERRKAGTLHRHSGSGRERVTLEFPRFCGHLNSER